MDWLTFVVEMIKALVWPSVVLTLLILLRRPIQDLIPLLERVRYKDLEMSFRGGAEALSTAVDEKLPPIQELRSPDEQIIELARRSPHSAVLVSYIKVESAALDALRRVAGGEQDSVTGPIQRVIGLLNSKGKLSPDIVGLLHELRRLRNVAVHNPDHLISYESALDYAKAADRVADYLRRIS